MTATEYRAALETLGLTQIGAAPVLGVNVRTAQRYAERGPSGGAEAAMLLLLRMPATAAARFIKERKGQ